MKNIAAITLFVLGAFLAVGPAHAQDHRLKATVPFDFTVGDRTIPSGTYTISSNMNDPNLVAIQSWSGKVGVLSLGQPDQTHPGHDNKLVFHKYGSEYFLTEIRCNGSSMNLHFPTSKAEKRARTQVQEAGLFPNDPVLIALK